MIRFSLNRVMKQKNLTIQDVMNATGITRPTISQLSNGKAKGIQFDTLNKLVSGLNIDVNELFEEVYPESGLKYSIAKVPNYKELIGKPNKVVVNIRFFYDQDRLTDDGYSAFIMPLSVSFKNLEENNPNSQAALVLSCTQFADTRLTTPTRQQENLKAFFSQTTRMDLEICLGNVAVATINELKLNNSFDFVIFRSDISEITPRNLWSTLFTWPSSILENEKTFYKFTELKYR